VPWTHVTTEERREWEAAATRYYQSLLRKYQGAIETVRLDVFEFLSQDNLDVSKFFDRHCARAKKTGLKGGLQKTRAYFALASLYGDVGGSYEPERLDWYRAQFVTELPEPLPAKCMFVHVTEAAVTMVLRDGNKNGQDVNQDLTATAPRLAEMLQLWMPHAASAQPDNAHPLVDNFGDRGSMIFGFRGDGCGHRVCVFGLQHFWFWSDKKKTYLSTHRFWVA
jgi:hypothetical protein